MTSSLTSKKTIVKIDDFTLSYNVRLHRFHGFKEIFINFLSNPNRVFQNKLQTIYVLKKLNLEIHEGDKVAFLGNNGAGKTSLCRYISGLYHAGDKIKVYGTARAIFETSVMIMPELTGLENLVIMAHIIFPELSKEERDEVVKSASEFSQIGEYLYSPIKTYSKGMLARLSLSLVSSRSSDLLILDEVFNGADHFFSEKISLRFLELINASKAVIFVSHSLELIEKVCNRVIVFKDHSVAFDGNIQDGIAYYLKNCQNDKVGGLID